MPGTETRIQYAMYIEEVNYGKSLLPPIMKVQCKKSGLLTSSEYMPFF